MNRRNFVVGLGTVATISGVASVTAAQFASEVSPTADFRVRPEDENLTVDRTFQYDTSSQYFTGSNLTDFNETENSGGDILAHLNNSSTPGGGTDDDLVATLTFNNTNESPGAGDADNYTAYASPQTGVVNGTGPDTLGFFQIINNGETRKNIGLGFEFGDDVDDTDLTPSLVTDAFRFYMQGDVSASTERVSPTPDDIPGDFTLGDRVDSTNYAAVDAATDKPVGLEIVVSDELYNEIQAKSGGAFSSTSTNLQLINNIYVGTQG